MTDKREYKVIDRVDALALGLKSDDPTYHRHALVAMRGEKLDTFIAWCYNPDNAQRIADSRNADMDSMRATMERTLIREDASDVPAGEPPADDAPRKRGRPRKVVDTTGEAC